GVGAAASSYGAPGMGGRAPVSVVLPDPACRPRELKRPPVVVIPDTGLEDHPWFRDPALATSEVYVDGQLLGRFGTVPGSATPEPPRNPLDGSVRPYAGHGTFAAGLVRQLCPEARILGIPVMADDGVVAESCLLATLNSLRSRQLDAIAQGRHEDLFDVLSL